VIASIRPWQAAVYYHSPPFLQSSLVSIDRFLKRPVEFGRTFRESQAEFAATQYWSRADLEGLQLERLQRLVTHAYNHVPAYRKLYADRGLTPSSVRTLADIAKFPTVSKQQICADRQSFLASNAKEFTPHAGNTSGTTRSPFQFF
jgi:phenylacetate-CoA ligase